MDILTYNKISQIDNALSQYLSWAGSSFPYNAGASDITISTNTTWSDAVGFKKVKKLIITAGVTLTILKSPFFIFADEVNFGSTNSCIDASGIGGKGGIAANSYSQATGGNGGGLLFIICNKITGANGIVKANGTNGSWNNATMNGGSDTGAGGQGALSKSIGLPYSQRWLGEEPTASTANFTNHYLHPLGLFMAGGGKFLNYEATGGGSGGSSYYVNTTFYPGGLGGSGIGGGGTATTASNPPTGPSPSVITSSIQLLELSKYGCIGGGGGGAMAAATAINTCAAGGGGGGILICAHTLSATPTLQANGGTATGGSASTNYATSGSAGVSLMVQI